MVEEVLVWWWYWLLMWEYKYDFETTGFWESQFTGALHKHLLVAFINLNPPPFFHLVFSIPIPPQYPTPRFTEYISERLSDSSHLV